MSREASSMLGMILEWNLKLHERFELAAEHYKDAADDDVSEGGKMIKGECCVELAKSIELSRLLLKELAGIEVVFKEGDTQ